MRKGVCSIWYQEITLKPWQIKQFSIDLETDQQVSETEQHVSEKEQSTRKQTVDFIKELDIWHRWHFKSISGNSIDRWITSRDIWLSIWKKIKLNLPSCSVQKNIFSLWL